VKHGGKWRLGALAVVLVALLVAGALTGGLTPETITRVAEDAGPLAFVALGALGTCVLFPGQVTAGVGGVLFGALAGIPLVLAAVLLGSVCAFWLGRWIGGGLVPERWRNAGFSAVLASRLLPGAPASVINYAAGVSGMRFRSFVAAVALGALPKTVAYVALGGALHDPLSVRGIVAVALYAVAAGVGFVFARRSVRYANT
jgi:uncharacterized membrane protein YdjX (TVP38/TMEM64 family)